MVGESHLPLGTQSRQHVPVLVFATWSLLKGISSAKSRGPAWGSLRAWQEPPSSSASGSFQASSAPWAFLEPISPLLSNSATSSDRGCEFQAQPSGCYRNPHRVRPARPLWHSSVSGTGQRKHWLLPDLLRISTVEGRQGYFQGGLFFSAMCDF